MHPRVLAAERDLLREADVVLASSDPLVEKARGLRDQVAYVPNGVDAAAFGSVGAPPAAEPFVVLYVGSIAEWFDEGLLDGVAAELPEVRFRVVGPQTRALPLLSARANVELPGPVPASAVRDELAAADLTIVPFRSGPLIRATDALKVYEAIAAGRRVLVTDMPQALRFAPAVRGAQGVQEWVAAIREARSGTWDPDVAAVRRRVAAEEDWSSRFAAITDALEPAGVR